MARKSKHNKPQRRGTTKPTTGQREFQDVVYMDRERVDGKMQAFASCTCNKWRSSKEATTLTKIAREAKAHVDAGKCALRPHEVPEDMKDMNPEDADLDAAGSEIVKEEEDGGGSEAPADQG